MTYRTACYRSRLASDFILLLTLDAVQGLFSNRNSMNCLIEKKIRICDLMNYCTLYTTCCTKKEFSHAEKATASGQKYIFYTLTALLLNVPDTKMKTSSNGN